LPFSGSRFSAGAALLPSYPIRPGSPLRLSPVSWPALRSSLVEIERGRARGSRQSLGPYRLRPDRATERISARLHGSKRDLDARRGTLFAGLAFSSSPRAERCGSGLFLCLAGDSADWSPFSQGISWSRAVCTVLSAIPAIWGCWSVRWGGPLLFVRESACCSWRSFFPRFWRGCGRRSPSCELSSAASTKAIVPVRHG